MRADFPNYPVFQFTPRYPIYTVIFPDVIVVALCMHIKCVYYFNLNIFNCPWLYNRHAIYCTIKIGRLDKLAHGLGNVAIV